MWSSRWNPLQGVPWPSGDGTVLSLSTIVICLRMIGGTVKPALRVQPGISCIPGRQPLSRFASGVTNCNSVSHGNMIQVSCDTSVTNVSTSARPAGLA